MKKILVGNYEFYACFTAIIEHEKVYMEIDIYLQEGREDFLTIDEDTAQILGL